MIDVRSATAEAGATTAYGECMSNCPYCHRPLTEIDYYGEMLVGCVNCNRWGRPDDENFILQLMDEDIEALRAASDEGQS